MRPLPPFDHDGLLPPGDYELDFQGLRESFSVAGAGGKSPTWDAPWREFLVNNLQIMTAQLWSVGVTEVFADGSFVEAGTGWNSTRTSPDS